MDPSPLPFREGFFCTLLPPDYDSAKTIVQSLRPRMPSAGINPSKQGFFTALKNIRDKTGDTLNFQGFQGFFWFGGILGISGIFQNSVFF